MRVIAIQGTTGPSGQYRVHNPLTMMKRAGHEVSILHIERGKAYCAAWFAGYDVCILQLFQEPGFIDMLEMIKPHERPALIYECDDLVWNVPGYRFEAAELGIGKASKGIKQCMHRCQAVFCSTPELAARASAFNPNVKVLPNSIDYSLRDWRTRYEPRFEGRVVIGWSGSIRPSRDMEVMGDALVRVLDEHPEAAFAIGGQEEQAHEFCYSLGLRERHVPQVCVLPLAEFKSYPQLVSLFDIGIAPLEDTVFNGCKSELKLLEYGAWGIPYVASDVAPYRRLHREQLVGHWGGALARTPEDWYRMITMLVVDGELRQMEGMALKAHVERHHNLSDWWRAWWVELLRVSGQDSAPREREMAIR